MTKMGQALPSNAPNRPRTLRWKKEPRETGLRAVLARPRSSYLLDAEGVRFACVSANLAGGWYFVAGWSRASLTQTPIKNRSRRKPRRRPQPRPT